MAQTIKLKRSSTSGNVPSTGQLELGELAINTYDGKVYIKKDNGTESVVEIGLQSPTASVYSKYKYTATASQTTFSGQDDNSSTLTYFPGYAEVYLNGIKLINTVDYTATSGSSIVLTSSASLNDTLEIISMGSGSLEQLIITRGMNSFVYTATASQTAFSGNDDNINSLSYTVDQIQVFLNGVLLDASDYTASNGTSVVITAGTVANDIVTIIAYNVDALDHLGELVIAGMTYPTTDGTAGQAIVTDGAGNLSFSDVDALPTQAGNSGKYLTTNGTTPSWGTLSIPTSTYTLYQYTATAAQTTFSATYTVGYVEVYLNGIKILNGSEYTATSGSSIVLASGASIGDSVEIVAYATTEVAVTYTNLDGGFANSVYTAPQSINGGTA
jgi:hypothetical protein